MTTATVDIPTVTQQRLHETDFVHVTFKGLN